LSSEYAGVRYVRLQWTLINEVAIGMDKNDVISKAIAILE